MSAKSRNQRCAGPMKRRTFLEIGGASMLGLGMTDLLRQQALASSAGNTTEDTAVIFGWLPGGHPHMEK
ncbi:MAG: hypothetical protein RLO18_11190 [Gimesia chilikensis]